jgi:CRP-like cAMP-binding protein
MIKSYLVIEKSSKGESSFPLETRATIGRGAENAIHLVDRSVSRRHAIVYLSEDQAFVEDLGSHNGTFVNGEKVKRALLNRGDKLQFGRVVLRLKQEEVSQAEDNALESQEVLQSEISVEFNRMDLSPESRSLLATISKMPLFSGLDDSCLVQIGQAAHPVMLDRGRTIIHQGDRGKSLYIILNGKVRVFTYDHQGQELLLNALSNNQFFGETSLLTGSPRHATVQAVEETLLCEVSFKVLKKILKKSPEMKRIMEQHCHERIKETEEKKRAAGLLERRLHPRLNEKLPVRFSVSTTSRLSVRYRGKSFQSVSQDISISGTRLKVQDRSLLSLPINCQLRLEIYLPKPEGIIRCLGVLRNTANGKETQDIGFIGVEFTEMPSIHRRKLERFLRC